MLQTDENRDATVEQALHRLGSAADEPLEQVRRKQQLQLESKQVRIIDILRVASSTEA